MRAPANSLLPVMYWYVLDICPHTLKGGGGKSRRDDMEKLSDMLSMEEGRYFTVKFRNGVPVPYTPHKIVRNVLYDSYDREDNWLLGLLVRGIVEIERNPTHKYWDMKEYYFIDSTEGVAHKENAQSEIDFFHLVEGNFFLSQEEASEMKSFVLERRKRLLSPAGLSRLQRCITDFLSSEGNDSIVNIGGVKVPYRDVMMNGMPFVEKDRDDISKAGSALATLFGAVPIESEETESKKKDSSVTTVQTTSLDSSAPSNTATNRRKKK